jgi:ribosomal protein L30E
LAGTVKKLFEEYYKTSTKNYQGVDLNELEAVESHFSVKINVYIFTEKKVKMVRHSQSKLNDIMNRNLYNDTKQKLNHFSYIKNINTLSKVFQCVDCGAFMSEAKKMTRHMLTCSKGEQKIIFEEGDYSPTPSIFEKLEEQDIFVERERRFYP